MSMTESSMIQIMFRKNHFQSFSQKGLEGDRTICERSIWETSEVIYVRI